MSKYQKLLEIYSLEEILESMELEVVELLEMLEEQGYKTTLEEPL